MRTVFFTVAAMALAPAALAGPILTPSAVISNGGVFNANQIIDQSSLSPGYVSGVTDFDTFVATATTNFTIASTETGDTAPPNSGGNWIFQFNAAPALDAVAIWNQAGTASLFDFSLEGSLTGDFLDAVDLGTFQMANFRGNNPADAEVFSFAEMNFSAIRLNVISNAGFSSSTRINEIAFRIADDNTPPAPPPPTSISEPGTIGLLGLGLVGLGLATRRKVTL